MAKYDFVCKSCGKIQELEISIQLYSEQKEKQVCSCGGKMTRSFSPLALTEYKCAGFYDTDKKGRTFR